MVNNVFFRLLAVLCVFCGLPLPASASAVSSGSTFLAIASPARGTAAAYGKGVYLVVGAFGQGNLRGAFVQNGAVSAPFLIQTTANYTHFPRVAWSPDADNGAGAFLVTWSETDMPGALTSMHARLVNTGHGGPFGDDTQIPIPTNYEAGNAVAYSTVSKEFLVVWQTPPYDLAAVRLDLLGHLIARVNIPASTDGERDPNVAYNPATNEFMVVFSGWGPEGAFTSVKRIQAGTGTVLAAKIELFVSSGTYITDISYNNATNKYLAAWWSGSAYGIVLNADGTPATAVTLLSTIYSAYDALSLGYNPITASFLMVSHSNTAEDSAVEIAAAGTPVNGGFLATNAGGPTGNFYPRVAASTASADWLLSTAHNFTSVVAQAISGSAGGAPPPPPPPPCTVTPATTSITVPFLIATEAVAVATDTTSCAWTATSGAGWITIKAGASGTGPGSVTFTVAFNATGSGRTGTITIGGKVVSVVQPGVNTAAISDMTGDGFSDLMTRNTATGQLSPFAVGQLAIWTMPSLHYWDGSPVPNVPLDYKVVGTGDLNGDGFADIVWQQQSTGNLYAWLMQATTVIATPALSIPTVGTTGWQVRAVGDVNGDGRADLVFQNSINGTLAVWLMNGATVIGTSWITDASGNQLIMPDPNWVITGAGDLNRDGRADLIWQNQVTGGLGAWTMSGSAVQVMHSLSPGFVANTDYKIVGVGDVNGDFIADIIWIKQSTGELFVWCMNGFSANVYAGILMFPGGAPAVLGANWTVVGPG